MAPRSCNVNDSQIRDQNKVRYSQRQANQIPNNNQEDDDAQQVKNNESMNLSIFKILDTAVTQKQWPINCLTTYLGKYDQHKKQKQNKIGEMRN